MDTLDVVGDIVNSLNLLYLKQIIMVTELQRKFKLEHAKYIVSYLFPEFANEIDDFKFTITNKYCWVCINARKPKVFIDMAVDNHSQVNHTLWGDRITKGMMQTALETGQIYFHFWNFVGSHGHSGFSEGHGRNPTKEQREHLTEYLNKQGITLPTVEEFYSYYYKD